ncbi:WD40-repeat-containing domain protein [Sparassis latifolia]
MRRYSSGTLAASRPPSPTYPETSAKNHLRSCRQTIDYSASDDATGLWPLSWSAHDLVMFGRGKRVHYKNVGSNANNDVGQLCKIKDAHGYLHLLQCGGKDQVNMVAVCTSKGHLQLWDVPTKKMIRSWSTKGVSAMRWNTAVLTVGGLRGAIRHFDTRVKESSKMKEQAKKVTRHQAKICSLAWSEGGKLFASGDEAGLVHIWDVRKNVPLDVGDLVQRRKRMLHAGPVQALAWCPWQTKILASGDAAPDGNNVVRIWNVENMNDSSPSRLSRYPDRLEVDAQVTSLHFSTQCKELVSTHGPGKVTPSPQPAQPNQRNDLNTSTELGTSKISNSVVVRSYPTLGDVVTKMAGTKGIAGSVLSPNGQRIALAVPEKNLIEIWDIWGKQIPLRRTASLTDMHTTSIR